VPVCGSLSAAPERPQLQNPPPTFCAAVNDVEADFIRDVNYDGFFYGSDAPAQAMDQYLEAALIAAMLAAICYLTGGLVDALLNPFWVLITEFSLMRNALRAPLWQDVHCNSPACFVLLVRIRAEPEIEPHGRGFIVAMLILAEFVRFERAPRQPFFLGER